MKLTNDQQRIANENIGLVGKVIKDKVHGVDQLGIYSYDDLFQIGSIGLCKAAYSDKGGCFSTYAYRLIWNEICSALIYATRRSNMETITDQEIYPDLPHEMDIDQVSDINAVLDRALQETRGVTAKGIEALRLSAEGYTSREIGVRMGTSPNNVTAWISKARKFLKARPEICALRE